MTTQLGYQLDTATAEDSQPDAVRHPIRQPRIIERTKPRSDYFVVLCSWEGAVDEVCATYFTARLASDGDLIEECAEVPIGEVSEADRALIHPGARFYWTIGYRIDPSGQRSRVSLIRFQRIVRRSAGDVQVERRITAEDEEIWLNF